MERMSIRDVTPLRSLGTMPTGAGSKGGKRWRAYGEREGQRENEVAEYVYTPGRFSGRIGRSVDGESDKTFPLSLHDPEEEVGLGVALWRGKGGRRDRE